MSELKGEVMAYGNGQPTRSNGIVASTSASKEAPPVPTRDYEFDAHIKVTLPEDVEGLTMLQLFVLSQGKTVFPVVVSDLDERTSYAADGFLTILSPIVISKIGG